MIAARGGARCGETSRSPRSFGVAPANKSGRGKSRPLMTKNSLAERPLFRRRRQRNRLVGQRRQVSNHIGALAVLLDAGKAHRSAGNKTFWIGDELVQILEGPGAALLLHRRREIEA